MAKGVIYKITNPSGKIYIGQTINLKDRVSRYKRYQCKNQKRLYYSLKKYGFDLHTITIIEEVNIDILMEREKFWIEELKVNFTKYKDGNGLNLCDGGIGSIGRVASEEFKIKNSKLHKGKKLSDETKKKISLSSIGRKHSEESKIKMSNSSKGKLLSEETKNKISLSLKGRNDHCFKKAIYQIDPDTDSIIEEFDSVISAAKKIGNVSYCGNIISVCRGRLNKAYNYKWKYKQSNERQY